MRMSWLYLARRSDRDSEPVLICPQLVATARSAIVEILGLARTVAHHRSVARLVGDLDGFEGLGQGADLVDLDQDRIGHPHLDAVAQPAPNW